MRTLSVAVVGAGPAGATAARLLASRGAWVTLLEARRLPRAKLCGGGLTPKAQRLIPPGALQTVERRVHHVELRGGRLPSFRLDEPDAMIAMVERARFDFALTEAAAAAGADVRDGERVETVAEDAAGVTLTTQRRHLRVDALVAADGDPSGIARRLGLGGPAARHALALEVDLPLSPELSADTAVLWFGIRGGFAWYFPKGDHANVGVGTYRWTAHETLTEAIARFARSVGLDAGEGKIAGHWIPQGLRREPLASRRVLLAGDAAATADPLFGEGIAYAIASGIAAAQAIGDWEAGRVGDLRAYDGRLRELLGPALRQLEFAALAAEPSMTLAMGAIRLSRRVRENAVDAIAGRRLPFAIDARCDLACACGIERESLTPEVCSERCPRRTHGALESGGCHAGSDNRTKAQRICGSASSASQRRAFKWTA
jgi:geranylgeranyl reductase family protein